MMFLTTIIPVSGTSSFKKRNLDFICARLNDAFGSENRTVIAFKGDMPYRNDLAEVANLSSLELSSRFVMLLDPDTFFDFKQLRSSVFYSDKVVVPFIERFHLNEALTRNLIDKRSVSVGSGAKVTDVPVGSGAILFRSEYFDSKSLSDYIHFGEGSEDWWVEEFGGLDFKAGYKVLDLAAVRLHREMIAPVRSKSKIVHAFNYACVEEGSRLYAEQKKAVSSYMDASKDKGVILVNFHSGDCLRLEGVSSVLLGRTARSVGHPKDFPFLNDIFNMAMPYLEGDGWIFYCNSDCRISGSLYDDILGFEGEYIEFHRQEVDCYGKYIGTVDRGIDGIAIRKSLLQKRKMPDLLIGAPYWDDAVSALYGSACRRKLKVMNQLFHTEHDPTYDLSNLDIAGQINFKVFSKIFSDAFQERTAAPKIRCQILVKVSTLGRPDLLLKCLDSFVDNMSGNNIVYFCVTCNRDDETMTTDFIDDLESRHKNIKVFFGNHKSKIDAYNADIENFDFDILVAASDDMIAVEKDYDQTILDCMNYHFPDMDGVLWFETCDDNQRTDTLSVMGSNYYKRFGYIYKSDYLGYYCDDEFTQIAFKLGKLKRMDRSVICHNIPDHLKMSDDGTYLKSLVYGMRDKALYKVRKKVQFDTPGSEGRNGGDFPEAFFEDKRNSRERPYWLISSPKFDDPISPMEVYVLENMDRKVATMDTDRFLSFAENYFRDFRWTIPPIIHQIWFGPVPPRIKEMMETFSEDYIKKNPGTRYIFWNEKRLGSLGMINKDIFNIESGYDCKSDIARLEILNKFGGFYVDSDCVWLGNKLLNSVPSKNGIMIAYEKAGDSIGKGYLEQNTTRCANGVFGATVANPIMAFMIGKLKESYTSRRRHGVVASTGPDFVQGVLDSLPGLTETVSHNYFYPAWWCVNEKKNPEFNKFLNERDMSPESLALIYPDSVLFHKGFTSSGGVN